MAGAGARAEAPMPSWMELWNEWEIQVVVVVSFSLQVILFFFAGIRRYSVSSVLKALLWLVYLLADLVATYALGHMSSSLCKKSSSEHQLVAFWAPSLLLHLGGQDTITAYALQDNELWLRHLLNMFVQVACAGYVLYKYVLAGEAIYARAAMLILASGFLKYSERVWALYRASKKLFRGLSVGILACLNYKIFSYFIQKRNSLDSPVPKRKYEARGCFTKYKQFRTYAFIVMSAHMVNYIVKRIVIDRNEASTGCYNSLTSRVATVRREYQWEDYKSKDELETEEDASPKERWQTGEVYRAIEVELALMYDMLYTKAVVIHTWFGYCVRAISLVSCVTALMVFTNSKRDGYSTPDIVITFALLGGACALEVASVIKTIGSTWTCSILRCAGWKWLPNAILFARYHLLVVKDGRWSNSVGQFNFISFCVYTKKPSLRRAIASWIGLKDLWNKAQCTKHAKLSPAVKEFVQDLLIGNKSHMVEIEEVAIHNGYWARRFRGFNQSKQLDWSLSFEFEKSVLIWHIATDTFLENPDVKKLINKDMAEVVNTLSDYMMYLLIEHRDILPIRADAPNLFDETSTSYSRRLLKPARYSVGGYRLFLDCYNEGPFEKITKLVYDNSTQVDLDLGHGSAVLKKADALAQIMLDMKLELTHKMVIIGAVWTEMLCYAATNASGGFHARQLSNGGEFLTHILVLIEYSSPNDKKLMNVDETVDARHVQLNVDDDCKDEITEIL